MWGVEGGWLGEWENHDWQVWQYTVGHAQLHLRGMPADDPGGECIELLFKPVRRLATSTMSWSGLRIALRRVTAEGDGVFFLASTRSDGRHSGHGVVRAGSLSLAEAGLKYFDSAIGPDVPSLRWRPLWISSVDGTTR